MIHQEIFDNLDRAVDYLINQGWTLSKAYIRNAPYTVMDYGNNKLVYYCHSHLDHLYLGGKMNFMNHVSLLFLDLNLIQLHNLYKN